jgi:hypothetical protein
VPGRHLQIVFHIGPHKTGTTSIQSYLLRTIGSAEPVDQWYPYTKPSEPGHAEFARDWLLRDAQMLRDLIARAESAGVSRLIVSAEDFAHLYSQKQAVLQEVLAPFEVHLVLTMNSLVNRAASSWQEAVKHGYADPLEESVDFVLTLPGYRPDFVDVALRVVAPARTTIIIASRGQPPARLIRDFCQAIGQAPPEKGQPVPNSNVRLFRNEADLIRIMNCTMQELDLPSAGRTAIRNALLRGILKTRVKALDYPRIETPEEMKEPVGAAAVAMTASIARLVEKRKVAVIGELDALASA